MKYPELVELSVRQYLGIERGLIAWRHLRYAIGVKINGVVYDYKTLEEYNYLSRDKSGTINATIDDVEPGKIYAIDTANEIFINSNIKNDWKIKEYMKKSRRFSEEYKNIEPKGKQLMKKLGNN